MTASEWSLIIVSFATGAQNQLVFSRLDLELGYKETQELTVPKPARTEQRTRNNF